MISIHAPLAGRDQVSGLRLAQLHPLFQSTRPSRGATNICFCCQSFHINFNPRAPRGARPSALLRPSPPPSISIHAPLAGRDQELRLAASQAAQFQSTRPSRGATKWELGQRTPELEFQSTRPSRGATNYSNRRFRFVQEFQSTRPSRGATFSPAICTPERPISIHAPLAGRDNEYSEYAFGLLPISIHAPLAGRDVLELLKGRFFIISIHAPLAGRDQRSDHKRCHHSHFNPRAPRGARQQMCTKITYIFALTHKRNTFSCQTPSVRALSKKLSGRFSHKIRCEPLCKTMCAAAPHYTISVPSGRYVCLQPKCSILLSYFFPK